MNPKYKPLIITLMLGAIGIALLCIGIFEIKGTEPSLLCCVLGIIFLVFGFMSAAAIGWREITSEEIFKFCKKFPDAANDLREIGLEFGRPITQDDLWGLARLCKQQKWDSEDLSERQEKISEQLKGIK